jgi:hypothetical protein
MSHEDCGAADAAQRTADSSGVAVDGVEAVLRGDDLVSLSLQRRNDFAEARAIRPKSVSEHDAWFFIR